VFAAEHEVAEFTRILKDLAERDDVTVMAWCLLSNHYHLAVRSGEVSLDRPLRSLQQRVTRGVNARQRVWGPSGRDGSRSRSPTVIRRRAQDANFRNRLSDLDHAVAQAITNPTNNVIA